MKITDTSSFLKQPPILPTPPFLREKSQLLHPPSPFTFLQKFRKLNPPPPPLFCLSVINETGGVQLCNSFVFLIKKRGIRSNFISTNAWKVCALFSSLLFYVINAFLLQYTTPVCKHILAIYQHIFNHDLNTSSSQHLKKHT